MSNYLSSEPYSEGLAFSELPDHTYAVSDIGTCTDTHLKIPPTTPEGGVVTGIDPDAFDFIAYEDLCCLF